MNRVDLIGRITRDPEVKTSQGGKSYCRFTIACDRNRGGQNGQTQADFISCICWDQSADFLGRNARKGALISVEGMIQTGSYQNQQGQTVNTFDVAAQRVQLIANAGQNNQNNGGSQNGYNQNGGGQPRQNNYQNAPQQGGGSYQNRNQNNYGNGGQQGGYNAPAPADDVDFGGGFDIATDDLPF
jgi:single-strand DNA-binding protein